MITRTTYRDRWRCQIMRSKGNVQIPYELFLDLVRVHLAEVDDPKILDRVRAGIQTKFDAMTARDLYGIMHDPEKTAAEREDARQRYLDQRGIPESFRW